MKRNSSYSSPRCSLKQDVSWRSQYRNAKSRSGVPITRWLRIAPSSRSPALCNTNFHLHRRDKDPTNRKSTHKGDSQRCAGTNNLRLNCHCQALAHRRPTPPFQQPVPFSPNVYTFTRPKDQDLTRIYSKPPRPAQHSRTECLVQ